MKKETKQQTASSQHHQKIDYRLIKYQLGRHRNHLLRMHKVSAQFVYVCVSLDIVYPKQTMCYSTSHVTESEFQWV